MTPPSPPAALAGHPLAVVDLEGNGAQPPEIVEIAVLTVDASPDSRDEDLVDEGAVDEGPVDEGAVDEGPLGGARVRSWLVRPTTPVTAMARRVHGITDDELAGRPLWCGVAREVEPLVTGRAMVAHAAAGDYRVLRAHLPTWRPPMVLDTLTLARHLWPGLPAYGLGALVRHAGLDTSGPRERRAHRAGFDAWCAWLLLCRLVRDGGLSWEELVRVAAPAEFRPPEAGLW
ncbi:DNA polymerase III epsilon subunit-like protein [Saccharothrix coeruleofusca]|uniref:3'-5' exonuclease n=1 Tax=Saccharothrix coeruleofusca TaxID=33919 RepID=UPI001AE70630|nr:3'-5' exonuclease [Saccharothrix coeruleofusca]MBP2334693.1 DNA polymerase III epsilon subunit-like protein [Saccharothrix coeruleofusca]